MRSTSSKGGRAYALAELSVSALWGRSRTISEKGDKMSG